MSAAQSLGGVRQSAFVGKPAVLRSVRAATPRARAGARLVVRAEKVVGIDLGTTNSAVRRGCGGQKALPPLCRTPLTLATCP
jgi:hypothetical protein